MANFKLISMNMRMATEEDAHLPTYDHTKLVGVNTCPTWGILRYSMHKRMPNSRREMALEAGSLAHEGFAAVRWWQYKNQQTVNVKAHTVNADMHGVRLFGDDRFERMLGVLSTSATFRTNTINFASEAIESFGYYDDIQDNKRTISNILESMIAYIDAYDTDRYPIWIRDNNDPEADIGIEIAFDTVVEIEYEIDGEARSILVRFTGKLDGLHYDRDKLIVMEDKSGARLDDSWLSQWVLSHSITGYCLAAATFTGLPCNHALISGMRIPIGRVPAEGIRKEYVPRNTLMFEKWANWFVTSIEMERQWRDNVLDAPMYTHSCNRYFRTCSFLPLCAADTKEEKEQIIEEMDHDEWSPLDA